MNQKKTRFLWFLVPLIASVICAPRQWDMEFLIFSFGCAMLLKIYISIVRLRLDRLINKRYGGNHSLERGIFEKRKMEDMLYLYQDPLLYKVERTNKLDTVFGLMAFETFALAVVLFGFI